ncbi:FAD-binding oxidoreductase [Marinobacter bryozoorum]|uniref:FAD-binding oxidoreductase n=1 Tax=Marinobacter bryozoorum TaxID=256324 RepID=UPI00200377F4|nr:FAD-binding oxidoreductase [Marinobacter bryozoorum]MCK7543126.1 FAD-binding oxidoreductase [Marinobacter bryozoorum]
MRRWNGWGDDSIQPQLPENGLTFLKDRIGAATRLPQAILEDVISKVPPSRLPDQPLISRDPETRIRHARGQSLPDWLAMRSGHIPAYPDGVARPGNTHQVRELLQLARDQGFHVIPYGGGTSVAGHINPLAGDTPVLTISMARMNRLLDLDTESQIATFGAGTPGPLVESQLRAHGYTLGHFPQSFELSTLGGWIASRSSGQQSLRYGRIEQLFAGGTVETLRGSLRIPTLPASSAGPDVREMILGSEGRLGIITEAKVRVTPLPEQESFHVMFFPNWTLAREAARRMVQAKLPLSMLRLSNEEETRTQLALAGHPAQIRLLENYLALRRAGSTKCMMTFGITGSPRQCRFAREEVRRLCKPFRGVYMGTGMGRKWAEKRFAMPYLRETLWELGYAVDTLETATDWDNVDTLMGMVEDNLRHGLMEYNQPVHVFSHLSHVYPQGSSIYTTYVFPVADNYRNTFARWQHLKDTTSALIVNNRGTISHQHGVGKDHAPWLPVEKGELGMMAIQGLLDTFDPRGLLNPGTLIAGNDTEDGERPES